MFLILACCVCDFQICVPMSVEFDELMKARDNPSEEAQSKLRCLKYISPVNEYVEHLSNHRHKLFILGLLNDSTKTHANE